jgi:hypothetical protein
MVPHDALVDIVANHDKTLLSSTAPLTEAPTLKGYLNKYANVAKGYNTRWFVLKNGVLSYYRHQEDELVASRGSITMKNAQLKVTEKTRFEISTFTHHSGAQKWYLKANHPVEAHRWTEAISKSIEWMKQDAAGSTMSDRRRSMDSDSTGTSARSRDLPPGLIARQVSRTKTVDSTLSGLDGSPRLDGPPPKDDDDVDDDREEDTSSANSDEGIPPHPNFELHGNATLAQLELIAQMPSGTQSGTLKQSLATVQNMMNEYAQMVREREEWWSKQLKKERQALHFWEESLTTVVKEGETLEKELKARSRRRGSRLFSPSNAGSVDGGRRRPSLLRHLGPPTSPAPDTPRAIASTIVTEEPTPPMTEEVEEPVTAMPIPELPQLTPRPIGQSESVPPPVTAATPRFPGALRSPARSPTSDTIVPVSRDLAESTLTEESFDDTFEGDDDVEDDEDEFFDAIEANNIPNLVVPEGLKSPLSAGVVLPQKAMVPYAGYELLRSSLRLKEDERPSTSLWSVLKHSIGKDLTKISFPVFFNEPTSMLQRMVSAISPEVSIRLLMRVLGGGYGVL